MEQYVIYPHEPKTDIELGLTPQDKLIYLAIRRYMNKDTMTCFPSYARITQDVGAAANTIRKCVENLVREGYLETKKEGKKIIYKFNNRKHFEPFSYDFLDKKDLTFTEKSYIVASQQYMFKDPETEEGKISYTNKELSDLIKMPASTISKCNRNLEEKGYLEGSSKLVKNFKLRELDQLFIWKFKEQDEQIKQNTDDIALMKQELATLRAMLKEKNNSKEHQTYIIE